MNDKLTNPEVEVRCRDCGGKGYDQFLIEDRFGIVVGTAVGDPCKRCNGTGKLKRKLSEMKKEITDKWGPGVKE